MKRGILRKAFGDTVPVMAGYLVLGTGFGVVLQRAGYGPMWAFAMSFLIYAGSMEFVCINLMTAGASLITVALTTLMVNARHLFYGISMVDRYRDTGRKKPYLIFALTDETYSLVCRDDPELPEAERHRYYFLVSLIDQIYWVTGSVLGGILGETVSFNSEGIEFALTALFVTVLTDQWITARDHRPALIGAAASLVCLAVFGAENFLIPAMVLITAGLTLLRRKGYD